MPGVPRSDLEGIVLGLIWSAGRCTAYAVRRTVQRSLSAQWSGSAGAIYPAVTRLEKRGLLRAQKAATGKRPSRQLAVTPAGRQALRTWVGPSLSEAAAEIPVDPLRTRLRFLGVVPAGRRSAILEEARAVLSRQLEAVERDWEARRDAGDPFSEAMARGVLLTMRARLQWLDELREAQQRRGSR